MVKRIILNAALAMALSACGTGDPNAQLSEIDELMSKDFHLTELQQTEIAQSVAEGKRLLAEGQRKEGSARLANALAVLEKAADADRFNKSE